MPDILIRGMKMPTDSPVYLTVCPSGGVYVHTYERGYGALVKSQYRVVELPEHGDLIDKSELLDNSKVNGMYPHWIDTMDVKRALVIVPADKEDKNALS